MSGQPVSALAARRAKEAARASSTPNASVTSHAVEVAAVSVEGKPSLSAEEKSKHRSTSKRPKKRRRFSVVEDEKPSVTARKSAASSKASQSVAPILAVSQKKPVSTNSENSHGADQPDLSSEHDTSGLSDSDTGTVAVKHTAVQLSDLRDFSRVKNGSDGSITILLKDKEYITGLGQYDIWVRRGSVSIMGAMLHASSKAHRVYAPACQSLPTIAHAKSPFGPEIQDAEVTLFSSRSGLRKLQRLNPKFSRIWNHGGMNRSSTFSIMRSSTEDRYERPLSLFRPAIDWQTLAVTICARAVQNPSQILICGPKGAGKSSFGRYLSNAMLSRKVAESGIAFLDLDPGQPEYSAPGEVSLYHIREFNLGSPFTHPLVNKGSRNVVLRSHYIGDTSPRDDVQHYLKCAADLYEHYKDTLGKQECPLLINSCGWIQGSGLEILGTLVHDCDITDVIYMSTIGPPEVVSALRSSVAKVDSTLHLLTSQGITTSMRSAADLRLMQAMSYFHTDHEAPTQHPLWDPTPLYLQKPTILKYAGREQDLTGIMVLGNQQQPGNIREIINGSVCALVAIEDHAALPPSVYADSQAREVDEDTTMDETDTLQNDIQPQDIASDDGSSSSERFTKEADVDLSFFQSLAASELSHFSYSHTSTNTLTRLAPLRRSLSGIPYLFFGAQGANTPLDPQKTRLVAQVLVRGIGSKSNIEVLSPLTNSTLETLRAKGTSLVLVRGSSDVSVPIWSYLEEYWEGMASDKDRKRWKKAVGRGEVQDEAGDSDSAGEFDVQEFAARTPWVTAVKKGEAGKGRGGKKWRARRNMVTDDGRRG